MRKLTVALASLALALSAHTAGAQTKFEPDLSWPKPLPDRWVMGGLGGVCVDAQDHVLILNRQDLVEGELNAGHLAPPMIELDPAGNVVNSWGDLNLLEVPSAEQRLGAIASRLHSC